MKLFRYNYYLNKNNYFGDGLRIGFFSGVILGIFLKNIAVSILLFTFLGGAVGALIKRK